MPDCKAMTELKDGERIAGKLMKSSRPDDVKAMYADWALTAKKAQTLHWEHCNQCQSGPVRHDRRESMVTNTPR